MASLRLIIAARQWSGALKHKNERVIRKLLALKLDYREIEEMLGRSLCLPLITSPNLLKQLLDGGVSPNPLPGQTFHTPLTLAVKRGLTPAVRLLLEAGADLHLCTDMGFPPLVFALERSDKELTALLLSKESQTIYIQRSLDICRERSLSVDATLKRFCLNREDQLVSP